MRIELEDVQDGVLVGPQGSAGEVRGADVFGVLAGATEAARRAAFETVLVAARDMGCTTTVGLTAPGLRRLGVQAALVDVLSPEFLAGAKDRTGLLDDPPPSHWQPELAVDWDVVVMLSRPGTSSVALPATAGFDRVWAQPTVLNETRTEPFGFADGRSNPVLEGSGREVTPGNGVWDGGGWRPLRAGEVLFGYPNEDGAFPGSTMSQGLVRNGSFLVWRKIEQHLTAFNDLAGLIAANGVAAEEAKELIIGRKQDGDPLIGADNDFSYTEADEWRVPRASHIRRANPRGTYGFSPSSVKIHRIVRRGMHYADVAPHQAVGTIFRCYQTSIADQFEFIQREWFNKGDLFRQGRIMDPVSGRCPLVGAAGDQFDAERRVFTWAIGPHAQKEVVRGYGPVSPLALTTVRGTVYLFVPGRLALQGLLDGRWCER